MPFTVRRSSRLLGISIYERGTLRRSSRLLGKSAMDVPELSRIKHRILRKPCKPTKPPKRTGAYRPFTLAQIMRHTLRCTAQSFQSCQTAIGAYPCGDVKKTCIYSDDLVSWSEKDKSTGITWVAVHAMDSIIAVFKTDANAVYRAYKNPKCATSFYHKIGFTAISEVADFVDEKPTVTKPFAVVCISAPANVHEVPYAAVDFLRYKIGSGLPITYTESIEIAIGALQLVHNEKFKANDIWVSVWRQMTASFLFNDKIEKHLSNINRIDEHSAGIDRPSSGVCIEEHLAKISCFYSEGLAKELSPGNGGCVEKHLADISGPDSGGLGSKWSSVAHTDSAGTELMFS